MYLRVSLSRTFFINEYYILIPLAIYTNILVIRAIKNRRARAKEKEELERKRKIALLSAVALFNGISVLAARGGSNEIVDVDYIDCGIETGLRYVNKDRLRKIVVALYSYKKPKGVIFVTATALCHIAKMYGVQFPALPIPVMDFGFTSYYQLARKVLVIILTSTVGPLAYFQTPVSLVSAALMLTLSLKLATTNLDYIPTSLIDPAIPIELIGKRIPDIPDVVSVNIVNELREKDKIRMPQNNVECLLPDQRLINPKCDIKLKPTEISEVIGNIDLTYENVVTMRDVTGLEKLTFSDAFQLPSKNANVKSKRPRLRGTAKTVRYLDKFPGTESNDPGKTWDVETNNLKKLPAERLKGNQEL